MPDSNNQDETSLIEIISADDFLAKYPLIDRTTTTKEFAALTSAKTEIIRLSKNLDVEQINAIPNTIKMAIIFEDNTTWPLENFKLLKEKNITLHYPLHEAAREDFKEMRKWLEAGFDPNQVELQLEHRIVGVTLRKQTIFDIIFSEYFDRKISERGMNVYMEQQYLYAIKLLLYYKADPNCGRGDLLLTAMEMDFFQAVSLLLAYGANVNYKDPKTDKTPLLGALRMVWISNDVSKLPLVRMLIKYGADVNMLGKQHYTDSQPITPLSFAISLSSPLSGKVVKLLLDNGARIDKCSQDGVLPRDLAFSRQNDEALELLLEREKSSPFTTEPVTRETPTPVQKIDPLSLHKTISRALTLHPSNLPKKPEPKPTSKPFSFFNYFSKRSMSTIPSAHNTYVTNKPFNPGFLSHCPKVLPPPVLATKAIATLATAGLKMMARR